MLTQDLLAHAAWANSVFLDCWDRSPARDDEELRTRWDHVVVVQEGFLAVVSNTAFTPPMDGIVPAFDALRDRTRDSHAALNALASSLGEQGLSRPIRIPWFPDPPCVVPADEALAQVALHTQHHRGQCMTRLRQLGGHPEPVDLIIWLWRQKPAARW